VGISISALDVTAPRETPWGTFPARLEVEGWEAYGLNLRSSNALLGVLGAVLRVDLDPLCGSLSLPEARRAAWGALARLEALGSPYAEEAISEAPRGRAAYFRPGFTVEDLRRRLVDFQRFVEAADRAGATDIGWG